MHVAVLGASPNPERYSNKAIKALVKHGHSVFPINPGHSQIEGLTCVKSIADLPRPVDTVTVYISPAHIGPLVEGIISAKPRRIIANPGAESDLLKTAAAKANIKYLEACTLVLLSTGAFETA